MPRKYFAILISFALGGSLVAADKSASSTELSTTELVNKNVEGRGGLQAWRAVKTKTMWGRIGVGGDQRTPLSMPSCTVRQTVLRLESMLSEEQPELSS